MAHRDVAYQHSSSHTNTFLFSDEKIVEYIKLHHLHFILPSSIAKPVLIVLSLHWLNVPLKIFSKCSWRWNYLLEWKNFCDFTIFAKVKP